MRVRAKERSKEICGSECKRVGELRERSEEGDCERRLLYSYNRRTQLYYWPKPEWSQAAPVIHLYLLEFGPFSILGEILSHTKQRGEIFLFKSTNDIF